MNKLICEIISVLLAILLVTVTWLVFTILIYKVLTFLFTGVVYLLRFIVLNCFLSVPFYVVLIGAISQTLFCAMIIRFIY